MDKVASSCVVQISFDILTALRNLHLAPEVQLYENNDFHYPEERGLSDKRTGHAVTGPLVAEVRPDTRPSDS